MKMGLAYWFLIFMVCDAYGFLLKCPSPSHRQLRAKVFCRNPATYLCLYDDIRGGFSENCTRVTLEQPGKVTTLNYKGNFDNRPCSTNLYQPRYITYWTNVSTDCIYQKSSCSEEGQAEYRDGGLNSDRTCTCDHSKGYTFVRTPQNPCFCKPLTEDCSCYNAKLLNTSHVWSSDGQCKSILPVLVNGQSSRDSSIATTTQLPNSHLEVESLRYDTSTRTYNKEVIIGGIFIIAIVLVILSILIYFFTTIVERCWCELDQFANRYIFAAFVIRPLPDIIERFEGESCTLECELSSTDVVCFKDNYKHRRRGSFEKTQTAYTYRLEIKEVTTIDNALYTLRNENGHVISQTVIDCRQMPKEILKMPKKERDAFLKSVEEDGRASRRFIRIMLVGKSGAGKTTLLKRLLEEYVDINAKQSTDGVDIKIQKCRINLKTSKWIYSLERNKTLQEILKDDTTDIAYCGFWDFAGQKEFYATHQTFLTPNAIYLLVVDVSEDFKRKTVKENIENEAENMGDYIDFWIDNIHCYATDDLVTYDMHEKHLRPPVLLVGTCIDKIKDGVHSVNKTFMQYIDTFISRKSRKWQHIIGEKVFLVSNAKPEMEYSSHQDIKDKIANLANDTKPSTLPVQWILMEKVLAQISNSGVTVISYDEVRNIAKDKRLSDLDPFLLYEHEIGNIIFFQDVNDYIILDQQWLVDAFRCLVGGEEFIISYKSIIDGKCSKDEIKDCLTKCPDRHFEENIDFLIQIFEQFDILVRPQTENGRRSENYYIPCMMSSQSSDNPLDKYEEIDTEYGRTSWLCMDLEFLPPALFNHILAMYIQNYTTVFDSEIPSFSKNIGTFNIEEKGLYRLIICKSFNSIALQVIEDKNNQNCYWQYREELILMVKKVFGRYKMRSTYWLTLKCFDGSPYSGEGKVAIPIIKKFKENNMDASYHCKEHDKNHKARTLYESWFGKRTELPFFKDHLKDDDEQQEHTCEFCSNQCVFLCDNCQQDMCCECFDKHQPSDKKQSHRGVIYDKFVFERTFDDHVPGIVDMVVLPDGLLVLVDYYGYLVTYDIDSGNEKTIPLHLERSSYPTLTVIDNNNVGVLLDKRVWIVDVRRQHIVRNISLKQKCLMCIDNMLYAGREEANYSSIQVLDISELKVQRTIPLSCTPRCLRYGNNGRIYCLTDTCVIVIYDMDLNELFTLEDLNIPERVTKITMDNDGNALLLSDNFNGSLIRISPNGKVVPVQALQNSSSSFGVLGFHTESRMLFHYLENTISIYKTK